VSWKHIEEWEKGEERGGRGKERSRIDMKCERSNWGPPNRGAERPEGWRGDQQDKRRKQFGRGPWEVGWMWIRGAKE